MNTVQVIFKLHNSEEVVNIPVTYEIEKEGNRELLKCKVNLPKDDIPEWLLLTHFEIPIIHSDMVTVTAYSDVGNVGNTNTGLFVSQTGDAIRFAETIKESRGL